MSDNNDMALPQAARAVAADAVEPVPVSPVPASIPNAIPSRCDGQQAHPRNKENDHEFRRLNDGSDHQLCFEKPQLDRRPRLTAGRRHSVGHPAPGTGSRRAKNPTAETVAARWNSDPLPSPRKRSTGPFLTKACDYLPLRAWFLLGVEIVVVGVVGAVLVRPEWFTS